MEKLTKSEQDNMNMFKEENDAKIVEKQAVIVKEVENAASTSDDLIADEIDEAIAIIQAEAVMEAAKSIENTTVNSSDMKPSNLEIEAALSIALVKDDEEKTANPTDDHASLTQCKLAASLADKTSKEARRVVVEGQDLMETISSTIDDLQSHIRTFYEKATEATVHGTDSDYVKADFYHTMASKYESSVKALENRARKLEMALNRVEECATECSKYSVLAEEITDESLDESIRSKFSACWWTNKGKAAIIVALKKERAALLMMKRIRIGVEEDMKYEERANSTVDDSGNAAECENRDRKTTMGHIVASFLGLSLLSVTSLFQVGSDSFNAILALGLLTIGWCAVYWSHKLYTCLRSEENEETVIETESKNESIEDCDRKLEIVINHLLKYKIVMDSETESDTGGSSETIRVDDISQ